MKRTVHLAILTCCMTFASGCSKSNCRPQNAYPPIDTASLNDDQVRSLASLRKLDDHPVYAMDYYGDYTWLAELKNKYYRELCLPEPKCSTFGAVGGTGSRILGHNSDGDPEPILLLFTHPPVGYASVTMVHLGEGFGFSDKVTPFDTPDMRNVLLYAPYVSNTGMNEAGLAYAVMADPEAESSIDPSKATLLPGEARRTCLDHAKNVNEAVEFLSTINVSFQGKFGNHWLFADAEGNTALVEWVAGTMQVTRGKDPYQVATNHAIFGTDDLIARHQAEYQQAGTIKNDINGRSYFRYARAVDMLAGLAGSVSMAQAMDILSGISLVKSSDVWFATQYSAVYDLSEKTLWLSMDRKYDSVIKLGKVFEATSNP